ncbi:MAG: UDP-N-acetylmuramoyl-L-alanyl-D-glutamate--2,6-diaminopimelate ligase [bacterium]
MKTRFEQPPARLALADVIEGIEVVSRRGSLEVPIAAVTDDSRCVADGDLFVAVAGRTVDGHRFVGRAAAAGAAAVIAERDVDFDGPVIRVASSARALGIAAANRAGNPARCMTMVGITGTNGKTTTTYLLESLLAVAGKSPGIIGTVSYRFRGEERAAPFTTPTAPALQSLLAEMAVAGTSHAVMEVSSHALQLQRVSGMDFDVAAFTNFTQDHLDLHGSMESYQAAKQRLFSHHLRPEGAAVLWVDDPVALQMVDGYPGRVIQVSGRRADADVYAELQRSTLQGLEARLTLGGVPLSIRSPLVGEHNLNNIAVAAAIAAELGIGPESIARGLLLLKCVPGRLERVEPDADVAVLVDYAHTPDALAHAIATLRPLCAGRLICVFGCGGDRDALKRPLMGQTVAERVDLAVVTSDNPRSEDPLAIIAQILDGLAPAGLPRVSAESLAQASRGYTVQPDRRSAIRAAIQQAHPGDVVLVAGKGHEDYQILGSRTIHFDDREESRAALAQRRAS